MRDEPQKASQETKEERLLALMSSVLLLRNVMIHRTNSPSDNRYRIILDSRTLGDPAYHRPEDLRKYVDEARLLIDRFERDPAISNRFAELRAMGFNPHFAIYDEPWVRMLMFYLPSIRTPRRAYVTTPRPRQVFAQGGSPRSSTAVWNSTIHAGLQNVDAVLN